MAKVLLLQLDGKLPNIALMRIAAHHRDRSDEVELRHIRRPSGVHPGLFDVRPDRVYASLIFQKTRPVAEYLLRVYPEAILGGTGWDLTTTVEQFGVETKRQDYSFYPGFRQSLGFTQRGCRLDCHFCVVPEKEGKVRPEQAIPELWRGDPWPRELLLLDNDFFGQSAWRDRIAEIRAGGFKVSFNQGINARMLSEEAAAAIASVDYRDDSMKDRRIYTAWDSLGDEAPLFRGLERLKKYGVKPDHVCVYMLLEQDRPGLADFYRVKRLREWGARPYPMPYVRTRANIDFQRWVVRRIDLMVPWPQYVAAKCRPERLKTNPTPQALFDAP